MAGRLWGATMNGNILAIDQGTTSSRAIVFNERQQIAGLGKMEFTQHFPQDGWVEHVPEEIWATCLWSAKTAIKKAGINAGRDRRDRHHQPARDHDRVGPGDRQADPQRHRLAGPADRTSSARSCARAATRSWSPRRPGCCSTPISPRPSSPGSSTTCRGARKRAEKGELAFGTVDSYLIWRLTGGKSHATDATNACRTLLLQHHHQRLGRRAAAAVPHPARDPARGEGQRGRFRHDRPRDLRRRHPDLRRRPATSRRRPSGRPASRRAC